MVRVRPDELTVTRTALSIIKAVFSCFWSENGRESVVSALESLDLSLRRPESHKIHRIVQYAPKLDSNRFSRSMMYE